MDGKRPPRVFISYSHDTVKHRDRVLGLANRLEDDDIDVEIDEDIDSPPEGWPLWCERRIKAADFVLMVCNETYNETYYRCANGDEERGKGKGVAYEARIIRQLLYDAGAANDKFVPVLFSDSSPEHIPTSIRGNSWYVVDSEGGYEDLHRLLTRPRAHKRELGTLRERPSVQLMERKWSEHSPESTTERADSRRNLDEDVAPPLTCETIESSFHYSDQNVSLDAYLPRAEEYCGICKITIKDASLADCTIFVEHLALLSTLFHGHHRGISAEERRIIAHGPSEYFDKYAIDIGGTRLSISDQLVRSLFSAIDALHDAYIDALRRIDLAWEAEAFSYYQERSDSEVFVCLGRLPAWLWSRIVKFAREHDYERGDSGWHVFDATNMSLVIRSHTSTRRFDQGIHACLLASNQSPAGTLNSDEIALLWKPPPSYPQSREVYPLSERRYWGAATTFRWMNDELIPKIYEWIWSNEPWAIRWSPRARQHQDRLFSKLIDLGGLVNDGRNIDFCPDLAGIRSLASILQQEFYGVSGEKYIFRQSDLKGLYRAIILVLKLQQVEDDRLYYVATNLSASPSLDSYGLIQALDNMIKNNELPSNCFSVDLGLRSVLHLLRSPKVYLNRQEALEIISNLGPLMDLYRDREIKRRHALT